MNTDYLKFFVEIANLKSINKASAKLFRSRSTLVAAMNSLEEEIGYKLLNRDVRGVSLTTHGAKVYHDAQNILKMLESWQYRHDCGIQKKVILHSLPAISEAYSLDILSELVNRFKQCCFSSDTLFNDIHNMIRVTHNDHDKTSNIVIGGYYDLQKEEFEHVVRAGNCIAKPLFSSQHSLYYNQEAESLISTETTLGDLLSKGIKIAVFKGAKLSIMLDSVNNDNNIVNVTSLPHAFNLVSKNPGIMATYPSFLNSHVRFTYDNIRACEYKEVDFGINYCLIYNEYTAADSTMQKVLSFIEEYPFTH